MTTTRRATGRKPADWMFLAAAIAVMGFGTLAIVSATADGNRNPETQNAGFGFAAIASETAG